MLLAKRNRKHKRRPNNEMLPVLTGEDCSFNDVKRRDCATDVNQETDARMSSAVPHRNVGKIMSGLSNLIILSGLVSY